MSARGLVERTEHDPSELSGSETQRVAIPRALVTDPAFLLADERTNNLDSVSRAEAATLFSRLHSGGSRTTVTITHEPSVAELADRHLNLSDGSLVTPDDSPRSQREKTTR